MCKNIKRKWKENIIICICGMAGSGKSTVARRLSEHYGIEYRSGGDALKAVAKSMKYKTTGDGWWETKEGIRFFRERLNNLDIDRKVDEILLGWAEQGNIIMDSRVLPWLLKKGFMIWLEASKEVRSHHIAKRDNIDPGEALRFLNIKEQNTKEIYKKLYGFNLGEDFEPFNLILDVNHLTEDEVFDVLQMVINKLVIEKSENKPNTC